MQNRLIKRKIVMAAIFLAVCLNYIYSQDCEEGYTYFSEIPASCTIIDGNPCLSDIDLIALSDIINENNLVDSSPIHVGTQTWNDGRLKVLTGTYNPNASWAINSQLIILPESFGNLTELTGLYLEWHSLTSLPDSFSQLTNLLTLDMDNNWLSSLPEDIGNISNLINLDLGYNQLASIPESVCDINFSITSYFYLFNNITSLPDCMCELDINWSGFDGDFYPYFGIGGNQLCETTSIPCCITLSDNFTISLEQFYYSHILVMPQSCSDGSDYYGQDLGDLNGDGYWNVLDIVNLANCVLAENCAILEYGCAGDLNGDSSYNILDIVNLVSCVLAQNCGG